MRSLVTLAAASLAVVAAHAAPVPTIADFAAPADIRDVRLSPSGDKLLIVRLGEGDRYRIEIRSTANLAQGGLAFDAAPAEVRGAAFLTDTLLLAELRERTERGGRGQWHSFGALFDDKGRLRGKLPGGDPVVLPAPGAQPGILYLAVQNGESGNRDVVRYDTATGKMNRILRGGDRRFGYLLDRDGEVRLSSTFDSGKFAVTFWGRAKGNGGWEPIHVLSPLKRETWEPIGFLGDDPDELTILANDGEDKTALAVFSLAQKRIVRTLYRRHDVDVDGVAIERDGRLVGARYTTDMAHIEWFDAGQKALAERAAALLPGRTIETSSPTTAGTRTLRAAGPGDPGSFYFATADGRIRTLGSGYPALKGKALADVRYTMLKMRDGKAIPAYLTRPKGATGPLKLVIVPHGGPWARDAGGFDPWAQMLAAQGYLVAQPEFRGSVGLGQAHWIAGDREWGGRMQDDLDDTVAVLRASGEADANWAAMFGWSYGGYAALVSSFRGHGLYRCAVAGAAVSDLDRIQALLSENPYARLVQKPTIAGPSPTRALKGATIPVLLIHGDEDDIVPITHGEDSDAALTRAGRPHRFVRIAKMGHLSDRFTRAQKTQIFETITGWLNQSCNPAA